MAIRDGLEELLGVIKSSPDSPLNGRQSMTTRGVLLALLPQEALHISEQPLVAIELVTGQLLCFSAGRKAGHDDVISNVRNFNEEIESWIRRFGCELKVEQQRAGCRG